MAKKFFLQTNLMVELAPNHGACIATDRVMVDGRMIRYMYRQSPVDEVDSGWCFFAGDETDTYLADPANMGLYDVNEVANYSPDVIALLDVPAPCAFERDESGRWVAVTPTFEA